MKPYFTLSKKTIHKHYEMTKDLADVVSYSSKTNPEVSRILEKETDAIFSVHLENELQNITDLSRVLFLAQGWTKEKILSLIQKGVNQFVVDNKSDLTCFLQTLREEESLKSKKLSLLLRLKLKENSIRTEKYYVFGMESELINQSLKEIRSSDQYSMITTLGIHFHRKTQNMSEWNLAAELEESIAEEVWNYIDIINAGGGLPSEYANTNVRVLESIKNKLISFREFLKERGTQLMLEPGRFIAAPAGTLHAHIIAIHEQTIIIDVSVYNTDFDALIVPVKLLIKEETTKEEGKPYVVKGVTPCSMDIFRYRAYLKDPQIGQELTFINAGAYNFTSDFCNLEKLETRIID